MKEIKAMAPEIWKMSIWYPKTSRKFSQKISQKYKEQWGVFYRKAVLKNFLRKYLWWNPEYFFLIKMQACRLHFTALQHKCFLHSNYESFKNSYFRTSVPRNFAIVTAQFFPVNFAKFLRTLFLTEHLLVTAS